jgi:hypothetical protein
MGYEPDDDELLDAVVLEVQILLMLMIWRRQDREESGFANRITVSLT